MAKRSSSTSSCSSKAPRKPLYGSGSSASPTSVTMALVTVAAATTTDHEDDAWASGDGDSVAKTNVVRFAPLVHIYDIPYVPHQRVESMWYTATEYDAIEDECEILLERIRNGMRIIPKKHTLQGLESWTREGHRRRLRHRMESLRVVLDEQFAQWEEGLEDEETIAEFYAARSKHTGMVALTRGLVIEKEVQEHLAQAVVESPSFYSILTMIESSPYIENVLHMTLSKSSSTRTTPIRKPSRKSSRCSRPKLSPPLPARDNKEQATDESHAAPESPRKRSPCKVRRRRRSSSLTAF